MPGYGYGLKCYKHLNLFPQHNQAGPHVQGHIMSCQGIYYYT